LACELERLGAETVEAVALAGGGWAREGIAHRVEAASGLRIPHSGASPAMSSPLVAGAGRGPSGGEP
jgi:hypothetical protein